LKKKAIVSVVSDLFTDQRVNRTCSVLHDMGFDVLLIGRVKKDSKEVTGRPYPIKRFKLWFEKGFLFYAAYNLRLFFFLLFKKSHLLVANDLDTLLPNYLIARLKRIPLVYDSHEYFTGVPEIQQRIFVKKVWLFIERWIFPKLKHVITVNDSIAGLYINEYNKDIVVVRNINAVGQSINVKTRAELGMPIDKKIVLLQGAGINIERGAEEAVLAMKPAYGLQNVVLYIIGDGDVIETLKQMTVTHNIESKVVILPKKPLNELVHFTANADIGITLDKDTNINYRYSLPNKIFDYIHAGIPVLASNLVEVRKIVDGFNIGVIVENITPEQIAKSINCMISDEKMLALWKKNIKIAASELHWEKEKNKLIDVFKHYV